MQSNFNQSEQIAKFIFGQNIATTVINAFTYGLGYRFIPTGVENQLPSLTRELIKLSHSSSNKETLLNIQAVRKSPDFYLMSPNGRFMWVEVKTRSTPNLEAFLQNNFNKNEIKDVCKYHKSVRFLYVDLKKRKICSIYGDDYLDVTSQYDNWYQPWTFIDGLSERSDMVKWQEELIFTPLCIQSKTISSRLENEVYET